MEPTSESTTKPSSGAPILQGVDTSSERKHESTSLLETESEAKPPRISVSEPRISGTQNPQVFGKRSWLFEVTGQLLAAVSLGILVVVLKVHQDKPIPKWPVGLTLNTIASIISTIFRSSLMISVTSALSQSGWLWYAQRPKPLRDICWFDSASRGPLGSLQLLWSIKFSYDPFQSYTATARSTGYTLITMFTVDPPVSERL